MPDTKKSTEDPKVASAIPAIPVDDTPKTTRVPADQPAEKVATPTVAEVKSSNNTVGTKEGAEADKNIKARVDATVASVEALNKTNTDVAAAKPFVKPAVETVKPLTPDQAITERVEATAKSVAAFNESAANEKKTSDQITADTKLTSEVSRVAPLTGELRADSADDSFVTPGKVPSPPDPRPGEPVPVIEEPPLVIAPLTGEVKPADEISYPTPGMGRDTSLASKALDKHGDIFMFDSKKTKFGVAEGQQVSLLAANEEAWKNDDLRREDDNVMGASIADSLRRNKRFQKNLR